ncbi:hypothetical protein BJX65DRAFT_169933 [Aspergillus insuetus]
MAKPAINALGASGYSVCQDCSACWKRPHFHPASGNIVILCDYKTPRLRWC